MRLPNVVTRPDDPILSEAPWPERTWPAGLENRPPVGGRRGYRDWHWAQAGAGATYVYVPQDVPVTDSMVERARLAGARWFAEHPHGASEDDEWRDHYRAVLKAAVEGCVD